MQVSGIDELLIRIEWKCKQRGLSRTMKKKEYVVKLIFSQISTLEGTALRNCFLQLRKKPGKAITVKTVNRVKVEVSWILQEIFGINLSEHPKIKDILKKKPEPVSGAMIEFSEFKKILELASSNSWKIALKLIYCPGIRPHELLSLTHRSFRLISQKKWSQPLNPDPGTQPANPFKTK